MHHEHTILEPDNTPPSASSSSTIPSPSLPSSSTPNLSSSVVPPTPSCPKCTIHLPVPDNNPHYDVSSYGHHTNVTDVEAPKLKTYDEAMASSDAAEWLATCKEKMQTWKDLDVYDIIPQLKGHKVIGSKWVFRVKQGPDSTIQKHKAHIVTQGFTQIKGVDFDQMFTPVAKFSSLHTIFALAA